MAHHQLRFRSFPAGPIRNAPVGAVQQKLQLHAVLILSYISPLIFAISAVSLRRTDYFLPVILPLTASLGFLLSERLPRISDNKLRGLFSLLLIFLLAWQGGQFLITDMRYFDGMLHREERLSSIAFYKTIKEEFFQRKQKKRTRQFTRTGMCIFPSI